MGLTLSEGAINRWWRAELLGNTVSLGPSGNKKQRK